MNDHFNHWRDVPKKVWPWGNFSPAEMACRKTGRVFIVPEFMDLLQKLRTKLGFALPVNSGYRTWEHDKAIRGAGIHPLGVAADINVWGEKAYHVMRLAPAFGFTGIGVRAHGPYRSRFLHLDAVDDETHPRPCVWSYR